MVIPSLKVTSNVSEVLTNLEFPIISKFLFPRSQIQTSEETKLHVLVLGSLFDTAPLGREITMNLARHVIAAYKIQEPPYKLLLDNVVLHFAPITPNFKELYLRYSAMK